MILLSDKPPNVKLLISTKGFRKRCALINLSTFSRVTVNLTVNFFLMHPVETKTFLNINFKLFHFYSCFDNTMILEHIVIVLNTVQCFVYQSIIIYNFVEISGKKLGCVSPKLC